MILNKRTAVTCSEVSSSHNKEVKWIGLPDVSLRLITEFVLNTSPNEENIQDILNQLLSRKEYLMYAWIWSNKGMKKNPLPAFSEFKKGINAINFSNMNRDEKRVLIREVVSHASDLKLAYGENVVERAFLLASNHNVSMDAFQAYPQQSVRKTLFQCCIKYDVRPFSKYFDTEEYTSNDRLSHLKLASASKNLDALYFLIDQYDNMSVGQSNMSTLYTALSVVAQCGSLQMFRSICEKYKPNLEGSCLEKQRILCSAVLSGQSDILDYIYDTFGPVDTSFFQKRSSSMIQHAASCGYVNVLRFLFERVGLEKDDFRVDDNAPILKACTHGHVNVLSYLYHTVGLTADDFDQTELDQNEEYSQTRNWFNLPSAAENGHVQVLEFLYETVRLNADHFRIFANDAIQAAVEKGHVNVVKYLHEIVGLNSDDFREAEAIECASEKGHLKVLEYIYHSEVLLVNDFRAKNNFPIRQAAEHGHVDVLRFLIETVGLVQSDFLEENGAIYNAVKHGHVKVLRFLFEEVGLDKNDFRSDRHRAIHDAAGYGQLDVLRFLFKEVGLDQNDFRSNDNRLLHDAARYGQVDVLRFLFEEVGLDQNDFRSNDNRVLHAAVRYGHVDVLRFLFKEVGLDQNDFRSNDNSPIITASGQGFVSVVLFLLNEVKLTVQDVKTRDNDAMAVAAKNNHLDIVGMLLEFEINFGANTLESTPMRGIKRKRTPSLDNG